MVSCIYTNAWGPINKCSIAHLIHLSTLPRLDSVTFPRHQVSSGLGSSSSHCPLIFSGEKKYYLSPTSPPLLLSPQSDLLQLQQTIGTSSTIKMVPKMRLPSGRAVLNLISVETEEGLSRAQTMLANEDLKPGMSLAYSILDAQGDESFQLNLREGNGAPGILLGFG